ncbi:MAG TPA: methyl-accepting chemotaxis protein [Rhodocyclaceae bacterium]
MKISQKVVIAVASLVLLAAALGGICLDRLLVLGDVTRNLVDDVQPGLRYSGAIRAEVLDYRNRETQLLITKSAAEVDETLSRMNQNYKALLVFETEYEKTVNTPDEKELFAAHRAALETYFKSHEKLESLVRAGEMEQAMAFFRGEQRKIYRTMLPTVDKIVEANVAKGTAARKEAMAIQSSAEATMAIIIVVALVIGGALGFWLYSATAAPMRRMRDVVTAIVEGRDFTRQTGISGHDEVAETAGAVDRMIGAVRQTLQEFMQAAAKITDMAAQLESAANQVSKGSTTDSTAAADMAATVEELTVSVNQVADNSKMAVEVADESAAAARKGGEVIAQTVQRMREIADRIRGTAESIAALGRSSSEITSIVHVIKDVADQTNLLALNAAIEAARAGEQGRGFAVVADEVRKLAERTSLATEDISGKIEAIQHGTGDASHQMDQVVAIVEGSMSITDDAATAIEQINRGMQRIGEQIAAISGALREQGTASNDIAKHVELVAQMSEQNSASAGQAAAMSDQMSQLAGQLNEAVAKFKV